MNLLRLIVFAFICLPFSGVAGSDPANAKETKLGWNVGNAANFMYATYQIDRNASGKNAIPEKLRPYNLTYYRQWHNRFKEDLDFLMAVNKTHVFIAFRGTSNDANRTMNSDGRPNLEYATRVHTGWWRAAEKVWKNELSNLVAEKLGDRKILVTGHSMGGAVAAYVVKIMQHNRGKKEALKKETKLRLVTFGAPRYAFKKTFFSQTNTLIFTVEAAMANGCVDKVVWDWQVELRKGHVLYKKVDIQKPNRKKDVYYYRCQTDRTKQKDEKGNTSKNSVHSASNYLNIAKSGKCKYVKYKACEPYKKYVD